jgi:hypothetical protein
MPLKPADLLRRLKETQDSSAAFKAYWVGTLTVPPPSNLELLNMVRKFSLDHLVTGVEAYAVELAKKEELIAQGNKISRDPTTQNAISYICATAHNLLEQEDPQERPITQRRFRNAAIDPDSYEWDAEAFQKASPAERQRMMSIIVSRQKAQKP